MLAPPCPRPALQTANHERIAVEPRLSHHEDPCNDVNLNTTQTNLRMVSVSSRYRAAASGGPSLRAVCTRLERNAEIWAHATEESGSSACIDSQQLLPASVDITAMLCGQHGIILENGDTKELHDVTATSPCSTEGPTERLPCAWNHDPTAVASPLTDCDKHRDDINGTNTVANADTLPCFSRSSGQQVVLARTYVQLMSALIPRTAMRTCSR